jgi:hypothetical protein
MLHHKEAEHKFNQKKMRQKKNLQQQRKREIDESERLLKERLARKKEIRMNLQNHIVRTIMKRQTDIKLATQWLSLIKVVSYAIAVNDGAFILKASKPTKVAGLEQIVEQKKETDSVKVKFKL